MACMDPSTDRRRLRSTRRPWAFSAMSVRESSAPASASAVASRAHAGAAPRSSRLAATPMVVATANRAEPNRRTSDAANGPATTAPTPYPATAVPNAALDRCRALVMSG